jgi:DNA helicase II / ATP-dependent DNA helicase PcrA
MAEQSRSLRNPTEHAVVFSTIHSAKGLEWGHRVHGGIEDGVLPHINANDIEEERQVAYVGTTRARRRLWLTYAGERYGERSQPSPFLFEMTGREKRLCIWTGPRLEGAHNPPAAAPPQMRNAATQPWLTAPPRRYH